MSVRSERGRSPISNHDRVPLRSTSPKARPRNGTRSPSANARRSRSPSSHAVSRPARSHSRQRYRSCSRSASPNAPQNAKIVVEKLTRNITKEHLQDIFGQFGEILKIDLPMNRVCGSPNCDIRNYNARLISDHTMIPVNINRGTAYITYSEPADAEAAISNMHEGEVDGAELSVSIILPRERFGRTPPPSVRTGGRGRFANSPPRRQPRDTYRPPSVSRSRSPRRSRSYYSRSPEPNTRRRSPSYDSRSRTPMKNGSHSRSPSRVRD